MTPFHGSFAKRADEEKRKGIKGASVIRQFAPEFLSRESQKRCPKAECAGIARVGVRIDVSRNARNFLGASRVDLEKVIFFW